MNEVEELTIKDKKNICVDSKIKNVYKTIWKLKYL